MITPGHEEYVNLLNIWQLRRLFYFQQLQYNTELTQADKDGLIAADMQLKDCVEELEALVDTDLEAVTLARVIRQAIKNANLEN